MKNQQHTIKNQICEIQVLVEVDYYQLTDKISYILQKLVYPELGRICDKHSHKAHYHNINRLEIDLGRINLNKITSVLTQQIPPKFEAALLNSLKEVSRYHTIHKNSKHDISGGKTSRHLNASINGVDEASYSKEGFGKCDQIEIIAQTKSQELELKLQALKYFLNTGAMPWWGQDNRKSLTAMLIEIMAINLSSARQLLSSLNKNAWNRLIIQQNDYQLLSLMKIISPELTKNQDINKLHRDLYTLILRSKVVLNMSGDQLRQHYWSFILTFAITKPNEQNLIKFINELISYLIFTADPNNYKKLTQNVMEQAIVLDKQCLISHPTVILWSKEVANKTHTLFQLFSKVITSLEEFSILLVENTEKTLNTTTHRSLASDQNVLDCANYLKQNFEAFDSTKINKVIRILKDFTINPSLLSKNYIFLLKTLSKLIDSLKIIDFFKDVARHSGFSNLKLSSKEIIAFEKQIQQSTSRHIDPLFNLKSKAPLLSKEMSNKTQTLFRLLCSLIKTIESFSILPLENKDKRLLNRIMQKLKELIVSQENVSNNYLLLSKALKKSVDPLCTIVDENDADILDPLEEVITLVKQWQQVTSSSIDSLLKSEPDVHFSSDVYHLDNSGLILYWVYLKDLFAKLGYLKKNKNDFVNQKARIRAVLLLNMFVDNKTRNIKEHELILNKILCCLPLAKALPNTLLSKAVEKQECKELTSALMTHWGALGKITTEGFRQAFIKRSGTIKQQDGQWILRVDKKPQDVLIDKLPWSINVIKLPWIKNPIIVEW